MGKGETSSVYRIELPVSRDREAMRVLHVDLGKIVSVTDARFVNRMGFGGYFVEARIVAQLLERPLILCVQQDTEWEDESHRCLGPCRTPEGVPTQQAAMQSVLDELRAAWEAHLQHERSAS